MTAETFIHDIVNWVLSADTKGECLTRFEEILNNPKLVQFIKDYRYRELICRELFREVEKNNGK
jgi:hypothetical protein